jgi:hypothetical protein
MNETHGLYLITRPKDLEAGYSESPRRTSSAIELEEAQEYLRARNVNPGDKVLVHTRIKYVATYLGLTTTEHDVVAVLKVGNSEILKLAHYSRVEAQK